jgi:hypothetical protein
LSSPPQSVEAVKKAPQASKDGAAAMYGMVAKIPDKSLVDDFLVNFMNEVYKLSPEP